MTTPRTSQRRHAFAASLTIAFLAAASLLAAASQHLAFYESGHRAMRFSSWEAAAYWFQRAADEKPDDGGPPGRISGRNYVPYLPFYYLGFALFQAGSYSAAFSAWDRTEARWAEEFPGLERQLAPYRNEIARSHAKFESDVMPRAIGKIEGYLAASRQLLALLDEHAASGPPTPPVAAAEIARVRANLPGWQERSRAASAARDYAGSLVLIKELAQGLDTLESIEMCDRPAAAGESWCQQLGYELSSSQPSGAAARYATGASRLARASLPSRYLAPLGATSLAPQDIAQIRSLYKHRYALIIAPTYSLPTWPVIDRDHKKVDAYAQALRAAGFDEVIVKHEPLSDGDMLRLIQAFFKDKAPLGEGIDQGKANLVLFHFVGHAYPHEMNGQDYAVLVTSNTPSGQMPYDKIAKAAVPESFFEQFYGLPQHHFLFTFETCSSGRFGQTSWTGVNPKDWRKCLHHPVSYVLTAGDIDEVSLANLPLTEELTRSFRGCSVKGAEQYFTGFGLLRRIQDDLVNQYNQHSQLVKSLKGQAVETGDLELMLRNRCPEGWDARTALLQPQRGLRPWSSAMGRGR